MSDKVITIIYDITTETPTVANIPYSKEWLDKLKLANGAYINDVETSPEQENIINEIEQRITSLDQDEVPSEYFGDCLVISPEEVGSWKKYIVKDGVESPFHSVGIFIVGFIN